MTQSLSASFRLRVQQKTQEKIDEKERRRKNREIRHRQEQALHNSHMTDTPTSSASTSRYSSQPDLASLANDLPPSTPKRPTENHRSTILPNFPSQQRARIAKNAHTEAKAKESRAVPEDPLRHPESAYREAMASIANDDWEQKCSGLNLIQLLLAKYPDTILQNLHAVVVVLIQEVGFLRHRRVPSRSVCR